MARNSKCNGNRGGNSKIVKSPAPVVDLNMPITITASSARITATAEREIATIGFVCNAVQAAIYSTSGLGEAAMLAEVRKVLSDEKKTQRITTFKTKVDQSEKYRTLHVDMSGAMLRATWMHGQPYNEEAERIREYIAGIRKTVDGSNNMLTAEGIDFNPSLETAITVAFATMFSTFNKGVKAVLSIDEDTIASMVDSKPKSKAQEAKRKAMLQAMEASCDSVEVLYELLRDMANAMRPPGKGRSKEPTGQNARVLMALGDCLSDISSDMGELIHEF